MLISVIIPHLNQPQALGRCLASLAGQSHPRPSFEAIVVDNGSRALPEDEVAAFDFVRLTQERSPGPGPARNAGAAEARGEILAFLDADCIAEKNWLASIASHLANAAPKTILGGGVRIALGDPKRPTMLEAYESVFAYRQKEYIESLGFSGTGNLAMRRTVFEAVGPFGGLEVAEDRDWGRRATAMGYAITYVPSMVVFHPARQSFREIFEKWNRHIAHDRMEWETAGRGPTMWLLRAGAVAVSPAVDVFKVIGSTRLSGWRARALACLALAYVRLYRATQMVRLARAPDRLVERMSWNRG